MFSNFFTVGEQVIILFILIAVGFLCAKSKLFSKDCTHGMTNLVLYIVTPCVIINSFNRRFDREMLNGLLITFLIAVSVHVGTIIISHLFIHDKDKSRECTLRFSAVFSNCGFMALPLQQALLGEEGVFYGAVYVAVFNLCLWSYGLISMSGSVKNLSIRKLLINPGIIGIVIGLIIFVFSLKLPLFISSPVSLIAALNTPLPMIIIGFHLADARLLKAIKDFKCNLTMFIRLIAIPLLTLSVLYFMGIRGVVLVSCIICASAPVAASTTMFALKFNKDTELSVNTVSVTTLLSVITMPLIVGFAQYLA